MPFSLVSCLRMYIIPSSFHLKYFHPFLNISQPFLPKTNIELILWIVRSLPFIFPRHVLSSRDYLKDYPETGTVSLLSNASFCHRPTRIIWNQVKLSVLTPRKTGKGVFFVSAIVALYSRWETQGKSQPTACRNYLFWCSKLVDHQQAQFRVYAETALKGL